MSTTSLPRQALKVSSRAYDKVVAPRTGVVVLIFHRVGASGGGQMNLDPATFERQVEWLQANCRVISLDEAVAEVSGAGPTAPGVVLTFDDGTADWVDVVAPILVRRGAPATFFLTTGYPEGEYDLPDGERAISWAGVIELASSGVATIGSHTHSHRLLDRLEPSAIDDDLDRTIDLIGEHVGRAPEHFAYPKAVDPSPAASRSVRARFASASLAGTRSNQAGDDVHLLSRSPIQAADSFRDFEAKVGGGMGFEDSVRRMLNRVRYRGVSR